MKPPLSLRGAELLAHLQPHVRGSLRRGEPMALLRMSLLGSRAFNIQHGPAVADELGYDYLPVAEAIR